MTRFQTWAALFVAVVLVALALLVSGKVSYHRGYKAGWKDCLASIQVDTTQHTDTSSYVNPEPVVVEPVATIPAGYVQVKAGTISQLKARIAELEAAALTAPHDSAASPVEDAPVDVALPVERKVYQDSTYRAVVEGIQARLAEIQTFNTTTTITKVVKEPVLPSLTLTPAAKLMVTPAGMDAAAMLRLTKWWQGGWRFDGGLGYGLHLGEGVQQPGWYVEIGFGIDIIHK
jgi:hypothetical protein